MAVDANEGKQLPVFQVAQLVYPARVLGAAGIDEATPQGWRRQVARGEEATAGATAARSQPARQPRTCPESPAAAPNP